jgi:hypothetical protein
MTAERVDDKRSRNADWAILSVLFAVGLVRVYTIIRTLGDRSFRNDEAYTYSFVTASWSDFLSVIRHLDVGVAAYYLMVRAWSTFAGASESSLRFFSVIFAVLATLALYYLALEFYSRRVAITAALLLLCNAFWFQQAQTARVYTLAGFLAVVASIAFIRAVRTSDRRWVAAYLTVMVLLAGFQLAIGLTLLAAHVLSFYAVPGRRMPLQIALPLLIALCFIFAIALYVVASVGTTLLHTPVHLTPKTVWVQIASLLGRKAAVAGLGALAVLGIAIGGRANRSNAITLTIWAIVPIALIVAMSLFDPATLGSRYMLSAIFPFVILASNGAWQARRRPLVAVLLLAALFVEGYGLREYLKEPRRNLEGGEVVALVPFMQRGDVVLFVPPFLAVRVNMALHNSRVRLQDGVETIPGPLDTVWKTVDQQRLQPEWSELPPLGKRHLWVIAMPGTDSPDNAGCNSVLGDVAHLKPGEATILCVPRERQ